MSHAHPARRGQTDGVSVPFEAFSDKRVLFTTEAAAYADGRPGYPDRVYELLVERCDLGAGTRVLEIGPGGGQATIELLGRGAVVDAVELGAELARELRARCPSDRLTIEVGPFEDHVDDGRRFDLVCAATSFHWVPVERGLEQVARVLEPGGWLALWWTVFGDPDRHDPFNDALQPVLRRSAPTLLDPAFMAGVHPYALDTATRIGEIDATGRFAPVHHEVIAWTGVHTASELRALFATFSPWLALPPPEREAALDAIEQLATDQFDGRVERSYLTPVYLAQRSASQG